jgi:hypothetical protein
VPPEPRHAAGSGDAPESEALHWTTAGPSVRRSTGVGRPPAPSSDRGDAQGAARASAPRPAAGPRTGPTLGARPNTAPDAASAAGTRAATGAAAAAGTVSGGAWAAAFRGSFQGAEPWPTIGERIILATIAWLPLALLIGYGGAALSGCDRAAASCSPSVQPIELGLIAIVLAIVAILPKAAYLGTWAAAGVTITGLVLAVPASILGNRSPIPGPVVAVGLAILAAGYAAGALFARRDRPIQRPWMIPARRRPPRPERNQR